MTILHSVTLARAGSDVVAQALVDAELHSLSKCILFFDIDPAVMEALPSSALPAFRTKLCARLKEKREDFDEAALDGTSSLGHLHYILRSMRTAYSAMMSETVSTALRHVTPPSAPPVGLGETPGAPVRPLSVRGTCYESVKLQMPNQRALGLDQRPPSDIVDKMIVTIGDDPPSFGPNIETLSPIFGREEPLLARYKYMRAGREVFRAGGVVCSGEMGVGHLANLVNSDEADEINARRPGAATNMRVGAQWSDVNEFCDALDKFIEDEGATPYQTKMLYAKQFSHATKTIESDACSFTTPLRVSLRRGFELGPPQPSSGSGGRARGSATSSGLPPRGGYGRSGGKARVVTDSESGSDSDAPPRRRHKKETKSSKKTFYKHDKFDKGDKPEKKKVKLDLGSDDEWDPSMGGSKTSKMACFAEAHNPGGCKKGRDCDFSHRPSLIVAERKRKAKALEKKKKEEDGHSDSD